MGHHPDIWYEAALFLQESSKTLQEKGVGTMNAFHNVIECVQLCISQGSWTFLQQDKNCVSKITKIFIVICGLWPWTSTIMSDNVKINKI